MDGLKPQPDIQERLYVINRAGSGEAHYLQLNSDRTEISCYQVKTDTWKVIKDICYFGAIVVNNSLYIIGGYNRKKAFHVDSVWRFNPKEVKWIERQHLLRPRAKFACCEFQGKIVVTGGELMDGTVTSSCEIYDPENDRWDFFKSLLAPRANHACAVIGETIYVAGGFYGKKSHKNFWIYEQGRWQELDPDCPHNLPLRLDRHTIVPHCKKLYFIGGVSCRETPNTFEKYRFETERRMFAYTTNVSAVHDDNFKSVHSNLVSPWNHKLPTMIFARQGVGAMVIGQRLYIMGGSVIETGQQVRIAEHYDIITGHWEEEFRFRKGDVSNVTCVCLSVPRVQNTDQIHKRLKWVLW